MTLVAVYFWVPLVWGWIKPAGGPAPSPAADPNAGFLPQLAGSQAPSPTTDKASAMPQRPWYQLVDWMERDPRKQPALLSNRQHDPFHSEVAMAKTRVESLLKPKPVATPESLGLKLSGTIVGGDRRVAVINGRTYREGAALESKKGGSEVRIKLIAVRPREVLVQVDGQEFTLQAPARMQKGEIEPFGSTE